MVLIELSLEELESARKIGKARHDYKNEWPMDWNHDGNTPVGVAIEGTIGEMAYAKYWGVKIDEHLYQRGQGDGGTDLVLPKGETVDVKASSKLGGHLILNELPPAIYLKRPHYYALCFNTKSKTTFNLAGIVSAAEFSNLAYIKDFGFGTRYVMHQSELSPPDGLRHDETLAHQLTFQLD